MLKDCYWTLICLSFLLLPKLDMFVCLSEKKTLYLQTYRLIFVILRICQVVLFLSEKYQISFLVLCSSKLYWQNHCNPYDCYAPFPNIFKFFTNFLTIRNKTSSISIAPLNLGASFLKVTNTLCQISPTCFQRTNIDIQNLKNTFGFFYQWMEVPVVSKKVELQSLYLKCCIYLYLLHFIKLLSAQYGQEDTVFSISLNNFLILLKFYPAIIFFLQKVNLIIPVKLYLYLS